MSDQPATTFPQWLIDVGWKVERMPAEAKGGLVEKCRAFMQGARNRHEGQASEYDRWKQPTRDAWLNNPDVPEYLKQWTRENENAVPSVEQFPEAGPRVDEPVSFHYQSEADRHRPRTLEEKCLLLAAIHDQVCQGAEKLIPIPERPENDPDAWFKVRDYYLLRGEVRELEDNDRPMVESTLAEVLLALDADLAGVDSPPAPQGDGKADAEEHSAPGSPAAGGRRRSRSIPKAAEMVGKAHLVEKALNAQIANDTGRSITEILGDAQVERKVFNTSPHFQSARDAWSTVKDNRAREKSERRGGRAPIRQIEYWSSDEG